MKRLNADEIIITNAELESIHEFIRSTLHSDWDSYTDNFICRITTEEGLRKMDPDMYDMAQQMSII